MSYFGERALTNARYMVNVIKVLAITVIIPAGLEILESYLAMRQESRLSLNPREHQLHLFRAAPLLPQDASHNPTLSQYLLLKIFSIF